MAINIQEAIKRAKEDSTKPVTKEELMAIYSEGTGIKESHLKYLPMGEVLNRYALSARRSEADSMGALDYILKVPFIGRMLSFYNKFIDNNNYRTLTLEDRTSSSLTRKTPLYQVWFNGGMDKNYLLSEGMATTDMIDSKIELLPEAWGKAFKIPYKNTLDDYFNIIASVPQMMARSAAYHEIAQFWSFFETQVSLIVKEANANITDAALSYETAMAGYQAILKQKAPNAEYAGISGMTLVTGTDNFDAANTICKDPFRGADDRRGNNLAGILTPMFYPSLGTKWFIIADPNVVPVFITALFAPWGCAPVVIKKRSDIDVVMGSSDAGLSAVEFETMSIIYACLNAFQHTLADTAADGFGIYGNPDGVE